ncbi:hypothetical protein [Megamonas hypermegale]|uniref:hypothetical protein n=1 Tax=Megamonas hypermegale TaxID=158847 RepID=UPI0026E92990|nr:hypothetical protein [Megamonas hypermegale]
MKNLILKKGDVYTMFMIQTSKKYSYSLVVNDLVGYVNKYTGEITVIDLNNYLEDGLYPETEPDFYKAKDDIRNNPQNYIRLPEKPYRYPEIDDASVWNILEAWAEENNITFI